MLELILGRAGTGKTTLLRKNLAESTAQKTVLIVPERYTASRAWRRRHFCGTAAERASALRTAADAS